MGDGLDDGVSLGRELGVEGVLGGEDLGENGSISPFLAVDQKGLVGSGFGFFVGIIKFSVIF